MGGNSNSGGCRERKVRKRRKYRRRKGSRNRRRQSPTTSTASTTDPCSLTPPLSQNLYKRPTIPQTIRLISIISIFIYQVLFDSFFRQGTLKDSRKRARKTQSRSLRHGFFGPENCDKYIANLKPRPWALRGFGHGFEGLGSAWAPLGFEPKPAHHY